MFNNWLVGSCQSDSALVHGDFPWCKRKGHCSREITTTDRMDLWDSGLPILAVSLSPVLRVVLQKMHRFKIWFPTSIKINLLIWPLSSQAIDSRDSVAMALYSQCFAWVIKKINSRIKGRDDFKSIGILDIFGFENFEVGSECFVCRWDFSLLVLVLLHNTLRVVSLPLGLVFMICTSLVFCRLIALNNSILTMQMKSCRSTSTSTFFH